MQKDSERDKGLIQLYSQDDLAKILNSFNGVTKIRLASGIIPESICLTVSSPIKEKSIDLYLIINPTTVEENRRRELFDFDSIFLKNRISNSDPFFVDCSESVMKLEPNTRRLYYVVSLPVLNFAAQNLNPPQIGERQYSLDKKNRWFYGQLFLI